jgi:hypothetical protein
MRSGYQFRTGLRAQRFEKTVQGFEVEGTVNDIGPATAHSVYHMGQQLPVAQMGCQNDYAGAFIGCAHIIGKTSDPDAPEHIPFASAQKVADFKKDSGKVFKYIFCQFPVFNGTGVPTEGLGNVLGSDMPMSSVKSIPQYTQCIGNESERFSFFFSEKTKKQNNQAIDHNFRIYSIFQNNILFYRFFNQTVIPD